MNTRFNPGDRTWLASDSTFSSYRAVFEDDGETGYFYPYDRAAGPGSKIIFPPVHIYNVADIIDRARRSNLEVVWSTDGLKAVLLINRAAHALLHFETRTSYCKQDLADDSRARELIQSMASSRNAS